MSALVGLAVLVISFPIQGVIVRTLFVQRKKGVVLTDKRVRLTSEVGTRFQCTEQEQEHLSPRRSCKAFDSWSSMHGKGFTLRRSVIIESGNYGLLESWRKEDHRKSPVTLDSTNKQVLSSDNDFCNHYSTYCRRYSFVCEYPNIFTPCCRIADKSGQITYALLGHPLTPGTIFSSLQLFNVSFPACVVYLIQFTVSPRSLGCH